VQRAGLKELFDTDLKNLKAHRPPATWPRTHRRPPCAASTYALPPPRVVAPMRHATHHALRPLPHATPCVHCHMPCPATCPALR
jgi:hypothetical protein